MMISNTNATKHMFRWDDGHLGRLLKIEQCLYDNTGDFEFAMRGAGISSYRISKEQAIDLFTNLQAWIEQL